MQWAKSPFNSLKLKVTHRDPSPFKLLWTSSKANRRGAAGLPCWVNDVIRYWEKLCWGKLPVFRVSCGLWLCNNMAFSLSDRWRDLTLALELTLIAPSSSSFSRKRSQIKSQMRHRSWADFCSASGLMWCILKPSGYEPENISWHALQSILPMEMLCCLHCWNRVHTCPFRFCDEHVMLFLDSSHKALKYRTRCVAHLQMQSLRSALSIDGRLNKFWANWDCDSPARSKYLQQICLNPVSHQSRERHLAYYENNRESWHIVSR